MTTVEVEGLPNTPFDLEDLDFHAMQVILNALNTKAMGAMTEAKLLFESEQQDLDTVRSCLNVTLNTYLCMWQYLDRFRQAKEEAAWQ